MKFTSIDQALFELHNIAKGGQLIINSEKCLVEINPKAKISASSIRCTKLQQQVPYQAEIGAILSMVKESCDPLQRAFISFYWGYEDLFGCEDSIKYIASEMTGSYELNKCYILYYRDKCKRINHANRLAVINATSIKTAQNNLCDKHNPKNIILNGLYKQITEDYKIYKILDINGLLTNGGN